MVDTNTTWRYWKRCTFVSFRQRFANKRITARNYTSREYINTHAFLAGFSPLLFHLSLVNLILRFSPSFIKSTVSFTNLCHSTTIYYVIKFSSHSFIRAKVYIFSQFHSDCCKDSFVSRCTSLMRIERKALDEK